MSTTYYWHEMYYYEYQMDVLLQVVIHTVAPVYRALVARAYDTTLIT